MSQHDFTIANQTAFGARDNINKALQALASNNSLGTEPTTPYEKMWWYDTSNNILKSYKGSGTWINVGRFNQTTDEFEILDNTKVVTTSGSQAGLLGDQTTLTWETGTGDTESLVSPAKVKAAIEENSITQTSGSAPYYGVRAWGKVNGHAKVDGGNFASFDSASNTVTFTTAMPHANYAVTLNGPWYGSTFAQSMTVNGFQAVGVSSGGNVGDISAFEFIVVC